MKNSFLVSGNSMAVEHMEVNVTLGFIHVLLFQNVLFPCLTTFPSWLPAGWQLVPERREWREPGELRMELSRGTQSAMPAVSWCYLERSDSDGDRSRTMVSTQSILAIGHRGCEFVSPLFTPTLVFSSFFWTVLFALLFVCI